MKITKTDAAEKRQLIIFLSVAFALPYMMGILMGYAYYRGIDVSCFPMPKCIIRQQVSCWLRCW